MKWNIYSRVTVLEQQVKDLTDFSGDQSRMIARLEEKLRQIDNQLFIQAIESMREKREKKNAYARAYYARTKGAKQ
jgi:ATP-dependent protease HslVU (ClpYQ) peptidase subunit